MAAVDALIAAVASAYKILAFSVTGAVVRTGGLFASRAFVPSRADAVAINAVSSLIAFVPAVFLPAVIALEAGVADAAGGNTSAVAAAIVRANWSIAVSTSPPLFAEAFPGGFIAPAAVCAVARTALQAAVLAVESGVAHAVAVNAFSLSRAGVWTHFN